MKTKTIIEKKYDTVADDETIEMVADVFVEKGVDVHIVENEAAARERVFAIIPPDAEVMNMTSMTLERLGLSRTIEDSGRFMSVRRRIKGMDEIDEYTDIKKLMSVHDWVVGSVHAITQTGLAMIASATGSQIPSYAYGADRVLWIVGAQKIVRDIYEGFDRIYEHCLPLENGRSIHACGVGSGVNKILILNRELAPGRLSMILVKEPLGF